MSPVRSSNNAASNFMLSGNNSNMVASYPADLNNNGTNLAVQMMNMINQLKLFDSFENNNNNTNELYLHNNVHSIESLLTESTQICDLFKDSLKQSMQMIGKIQMRAEMVNSEITKTHLSHLKALEQRKKTLMENLDKIQTNKIKSLNKQISDIKKVFGNIEELVKEIKQLKATNNKSDHNGLMNELKNKLVKELQMLKSFHSNSYHQMVPLLQPCETDELFFTQPDPALYNAITQMGFLTSTAHAPHCIAYGDGLRQCLRGKPASFLVQTKDHLGEIRSVGGDLIRGNLVLTISLIQYVLFCAHLYFNLKNI